MDTAQKDLDTWRTTVTKLAEMATGFSAEHSGATSANFASIKETRRAEREAWQSYRAHWNEGGKD